MRNFLKIADQTIIAADKVISYSGFVIMVAVTVANVFSRFVFSISFAFMEEVAYMGLTWSIMLGICILYRYNGIIAIEVVVDKLPRIPKKVMLNMVTVFIIITVAVLLKFDWDLSINSFTRRTINLRIPYFFMYIATVISFAQIIIYSIYFLIRDNFIIKNAQNDLERR